MFLNHHAAFTTFAPATAPALPAHTATLCAGARVETPTGWPPVDQLSAGAAIATLAGGAYEQHTNRHAVGERGRRRRDQDFGSHAFRRRG